MVVVIVLGVLVLVSLALVVLVLVVAVLIVLGGSAETRSACQSVINLSVFVCFFLSFFVETPLGSFGLFVLSRWFADSLWLACLKSLCNHSASKKLQPKAKTNKLYNSLSLAVYD